MANGEVSEHELQEHFLDFSSDQLKIVVNRMVKAVRTSLYSSSWLLLFVVENFCANLQSVDR